VYSKFSTFSGLNIHLGCVCMGFKSGYDTELDFEIPYPDASG